MIQLNLMKAQVFSGVNDILIHSELAEAAAKVKNIYKLTREIKFTMSSNKPRSEKEFDIFDLTSQIMALTQAID